MAVNKVVMNTENGEKTLIDLTGDSVTPTSLAEGVTAHDASGNKITGAMPTTAVLYTEQVLTDAQKEQARNNISALPTTGGTMTGTLYGTDGISLTANVSSANNEQGITLNNGGNTARISLGGSGGLGIYSDQTLFIRPSYSEGSGYGVKMTKSDMSPTTNASLSLGASSSMQYNKIYGKTIYQNGKQVANKEDIPTTENWTFTLEDGTTVTKAVYVG